jgi:segregation and condensation protein B
MDSFFRKETDTTQEGLKAVFEAILFVSKRPVTLKELRRLCPQEIRPKETEIAAIIEELKIEYIQTRRSFRIVEIADGYQMRTAPEFAPYISQFFELNKAENISQPALETLAIIAYREPITKAMIEGVRGVDCSGVIKSLYEKGLVKIAGRLEVPGRPFIYSTTERFLEHFGLRNIEDLPHRGELRVLEENQGKLDFSSEKKDEEKHKEKTEVGDKADAETAAGGAERDGQQD